MRKFPKRSNVEELFMKKTTPILIIALATTLLTSTSYARKPAVLPVTGISIDDQPQIDQSKAQRFDFSSEQPKLTRVPASNPKKSFTFGNSFIIGLFISFPILMWIYMLVNLRRKQKSKLDANLLILSDYKIDSKDKQKNKFKKAA